MTIAPTPLKYGTAAKRPKALLCSLNTSNSDQAHLFSNFLHVNSAIHPDNHLFAMFGLLRRASRLMVDATSVARCRNPSAGDHFRASTSTRRAAWVTIAVTAVRWQRDYLTVSRRDSNAEASAKASLPRAARKTLNPCLHPTQASSALTEPLRCASPGDRSVQFLCVLFICAPSRIYIRHSIVLAK